MMKKKLSIVDIKNKKGNDKIVSLTAYTSSMARILDQHCDLLLVGDSVGMVIYGMDSTMQVTVDMMVNHGKAVVKAVNQACVMVDMPFGSYGTAEKAYDTAVRILKETSCDAVKLEGGAAAAEIISFLTKNGIPVVGHIGLTPQFVKKLGGYKCQGKSEESYHSIIDDAKAVSDAGAFALVLECVTESLATEITSLIPIPTIGIGASVFCDGQILVTDDLLGLTDISPRFVKKFADIRKEIDAAIFNYHNEVRNKIFPDSTHTFK